MDVATTRRALLKAATGAAAYGAGVTTISVGAIVATAHGTAEAAVPAAVSPELTRLIALHDSAMTACRDYDKGDYAAAAERWRQMRDAIPHVEMEMADGRVWSTADEHHHSFAKYQAKQRVTFSGAGATDAEARHKAMCRYAAAVEKRAGEVAEAREASGLNAAFARSEELEEAEVAATRAVENFPVTTLIDLNAKMTFLVDTGGFACDATPDILLADLVRLLGREG
jgi:hypothetical protein